MKRSELKRAKQQKCVRCGAEFSRSRIGRYCSQACMGLAQRKSRTCQMCGAEFWFAGAPRRKTCSSACAMAARTAILRGAKRPPEMVQRMVASARANRTARELAVMPPSARRCARPGCQSALTGQAAIYCSPRCHYDDRGRVGVGRRATRYHRCQGCAQTFVWNGRGRGIFCSAYCARHSTPRQRQPEVVEVVQIRGYRRIDFFDDVGSCRWCGGRPDHMHHVVYRQHVERVKGDRWHPDNALALCIKCHGRAHAHELPLSRLRDENLAFAIGVLGAYAGDYLRRYYLDDADPRLAGVRGEDAA